MRSCSSSSLTKTLKNVRRHKLAQYRHPNWRNLLTIFQCLYVVDEPAGKGKQIFSLFIVLLLEICCFVRSVRQTVCFFFLSFTPLKKKCCCRRPWSSDGGGVIFPSSPTAFLCLRYRDIFVPAAGRESRRSGRTSRPTTSIIVVVIVGPLVTMYRRGSLQYRFVPTTRRWSRWEEEQGVGNNRQR